jgi:hypothetical protein
MSAGCARELARWRCRSRCALDTSLVLDGAGISGHGLSAHGLELDLLQLLDASTMGFRERCMLFEQIVPSSQYCAPLRA